MKEVAGEDIRVGWQHELSGALLDSDSLLNRFEQALPIAGFERIDVEIVREVHERVAGVRPLVVCVALLSQADHEPVAVRELKRYEDTGLARPEWLDADLGADGVGEGVGKLQQRHSSVP